MSTSVGSARVVLILAVLASSCAVLFLARPIVIEAQAAPAALPAADRPFGTLREQAVMQQGWLKKRLDTFLPAIMRKHGIDLWVVPSYNPDGLARGSRRNARGVDLNRNYPYHWAPLGGSYYSGPRPGSEPETRAMMGFLARVKPDWVLSFHQPLHGVDIAVERPGFARRVARILGLPTTTLDCGGVCHGTMTGWYNHHFGGFALTVEYGGSPPTRLMRKTAPGQVMRIFGAWRGNNRFDVLP